MSGNAAAGGRGWLCGCIAVAMAAEVAGATVASAPPSAVATPPAAAEPPSLAPDAERSTLETLRSEFSRLRASPSGVTREFLERLLRAMEPDTLSLADRIAASKLLAATYTELADHALARQAFLVGVGLVDERDGTAAAAAYAGEYADQLVAEGNHLDGLALYDWVLAQYPDTPAGERAGYMSGQCLESLREPQKAVEAYEQLIAKRPDSAWAARARQQLPMLLRNMARGDDAIRQLREMAQEAPGEDQAGYAHFQIGMILYAKGLSGYGEAVEEFRLLTERYPDHRYAESAEKMLSTIRYRIAKEFNEENMP